MRWIPVLVLLSLVVAGSEPAVGATAAGAAKDTAADPLPEDFDSLLRAAWWVFVASGPK